MNIMQRMVEAFHLKMGAPIGDTENPAIARAKLRGDLIQEELDEFRDACEKGDIVGAVDALGDLLYVVFGAGVEFGLDLEPFFFEIHASNMTKTGGGVRGDGKILKGPDYRPPKLEKVFISRLGVVPGREVEP